MFLANAISSTKSMLKDLFASFASLTPRFSVSAETYLRHAHDFNGMDVMSGCVEKQQVWFHLIYNQSRWPKEQAREILTDIISQLLDSMYEQSMDNFNAVKFSTHLKGAAKRVHIHVSSALIHRNEQIIVTSDT